MTVQKTLGKFETGSKAALPVFKDFVEKSLFKEDFAEFQIPENIYLTSLSMIRVSKHRLETKIQLLKH